MITLIALPHQSKTHDFVWYGFGLIPYTKHAGTVTMHSTIIQYRLHYIHTMQVHVMCAYCALGNSKGN